MKALEQSLGLLTYSVFAPHRDPMDAATKAIKDWHSQDQISQVECLVPDMTSNARGNFIPVHQFLSRAEPRLPADIFLQTVTDEYFDRHWEFVEPSDTDIIPRADVCTTAASTLCARALVVAGLGLG